MKNIQEVLREKEAEIERLTREIKLLRVASRILDEEGQPSAASKIASSPAFEEPTIEVVRSTQAPPNGEAKASNKRWP